MKFLVFLSNADEFNFDTSNNVCGDGPIMRRAESVWQRFEPGSIFSTLNVTDSVSDNLPSGLQISDIRLRRLCPLDDSINVSILERNMMGKLPSG